MSTAADVGAARPTDDGIGAKVMASWAGSLATVLESMTGNRPKIEFRAAPPRTVDKDFQWWGQQLSVQDQSSFWIGALADSWTALSRLILAALGVGEPTETDITSTCGDLMAQATAMVAGELTREYDQEISSGASTPAAQPEMDRAEAYRWTLDAGLVSMEGAVLWSGSFLAYCSGLQPQAISAPASGDTASSANDNAELGGYPVDSIPRLDLRVKFVLGRTTLSLREVFKLNPGSVIGLDRSSIGFADVVVHGRVLARGQVVVVNGNYGLKIVPHQQ